MKYPTCMPLHKKIKLSMAQKYTDDVSTDSFYYNLLEMIKWYIQHNKDWGAVLI